jgi:D-alanyl-D-alanine carboxypeptidase
VRVGALGALLVLALAGCSAVPDAPFASIAEPPTASAIATPTATATPTPPPTPAPAAPPPTATPSPVAAALVADPCVDRDLPAPPASDPVLTVLDRTYALDPLSTPPDLIPIGEAGFAGDQRVSGAVVADLGALYRDAQAAGLSLLVDSAYRSYDQQARTFDHWVAQQGYEAALLRTARPGHSEHQLGTAIDFSSPGWTGRFGDWASETAEGAWLHEHAWEYGFVLSYPWAADSVTCFGYEPWHYRWIGRGPAAEQHTSDEVLRTFLERYLIAPS